MATIEELEGRIDYLERRVEVLEDLVRDSTLRKDSIDSPASFNGGVGFKAYINLAGPSEDNDKIMSEQERLVEERRTKLVGKPEKPEKESKPPAKAKKTEGPPKIEEGKEKAPRTSSPPPGHVKCSRCGCPAPEGEMMTTNQGLLCGDCIEDLRKASPGPEEVK